LRRPSAIEVGTMVLGGFFLVIGIVALIHPTPSLIFHHGDRPISRSSLEYVSKNGARVYGLLCILIGCALGWAVSTSDKRPR
jgi:hypothetical protein